MGECSSRNRKVSKLVIGIANCMAWLQQLVIIIAMFSQLAT